MEKKRVLIIGAGASGLVAAITAARAGAAVTILEQNDKPGKKICATGNGKCNLTNRNMFLEAFRGEEPSFVKEVFHQFGLEDTLDFFQKLGLEFIDKNGYLYPRSGQAQSVVDVLCMEARNRKVKIKTTEYVKEIKYIQNKESGSKEWQALTNGWHYEADALILANGSKASAISGSDGSGYLLAESLGHTVIKPLPALTALKCSGNKFSAWAGVRTEGKVTLYIEGRQQMSEQGELQLTEYGVSGIPVFQISRYAIRALDAGKKVRLFVDFMPEYSEDEFEEFLNERREYAPYKTEKELLIGLFPEKLIRVLCGQKNLVKAVKEFELHVKAGMSFEQAQVCSGGVHVKEVDPFTMESKLQRNLYFAGELLDIDGICGGYNLQWAWSSGKVAGENAAK